jgi:hypothetical protein
MGGGKSIVESQYEALCITPHPRTLRKARENVRLMVADQVSPAKIKRYFVQWARWWTKTANIWDFQTLVEYFINTCWQKEPADIADEVLSRYFIELHSVNNCGSSLAA